MPTVTYPGVYLQELTGAVRPIDIAGTSTAAFVGLAEMGPDSGATAVSSWAEYQRSFGTFVPHSYLAQSVYQFFANGGRRCYIVRVVAAGAQAASVTVQNQADPPLPGLVVTARSKGVWGNTLVVEFGESTADPGNEFRLTVRRQQSATTPLDPGAPDLESFDDLSMDRGAANYVGTVLARDSALIDAAVVPENTSQTSGHLRAGGPAGLPLGARLQLRINLDGDGFSAVTLPTAAGTSTTAADVAAALQTAVRALQPSRASTPAAAYSGFIATVENGVLVLRSGTTGAGSSVQVRVVADATDAATLLRLDPGSGARAGDGLAVRRPASGTAVQVGDSALAAPVSAVRAGSDGTGTISDTSFTAAFSRLDPITDASLLAVPGENTPALVSDGMSYCANRTLQDMFYIGEVAMQDDDVEAASLFRANLTVANSYGALYFPWVRAADLTGASQTPVLLPPSGYLAGLYSRIDAARGVWKAPAGVEASLSGVRGLAADLTDTQHGVLNPLGVDVLRRFPAAGVVSFGVRTVSSDPEWRYIPIRRTAIMLRVSIYSGIQWAVFEPNDETLWSQLRLAIGSFMTTLFRQGAFAGGSAAEAFFVKCDADTTTPADVARGVVNVVIGFAPLTPAEFVVVSISQLAGQVSG